MSASIERSCLEIGGTSTRLVQAGPPDAAEAVVFVHGNPGSANDWERLVGAVGGIGKRSLAFDLPDFGETVAPKRFDRDIYGYARFLGEALEALGVERAHLVLHDFGGPFGLFWALAHPDAVASVTEIDTGLLPGYHWHFFARVWRTPIIGGLFQAFTTRGGFRFAQNRKEPRKLPSEFIDQMYDNYDRRTRRTVLKLYRSTPGPSALSKFLIQAFRPRDIPALVIWGERDAYIPSPYAYCQREPFPSAEVHVLPNSGHWPFVDAPETVERLLIDFLERVGAKTG
jgi:pimeloyl-ACP methyl ester carboxylesterase